MSRFPPNQVLPYGPGIASSPSLHRTQPSWTPAGPGMDVLAPQQNITQTIPQSLAATIPGYWSSSPVTLLFQTDASVTDARYGGALGAGGTSVRNRALWISPVFDTMPALGNSNGSRASGMQLWREGALLSVAVSGYSTIPTSTSLEVYSLDLGHPYNASWINPANKRQDVTTPFWDTPSTTAGQDGVILLFEPPRLRFWQLCLIFDNWHASTDPSLVLQASAV